MASPENPDYGFIDNETLQIIRDNTDWKKVIIALNIKIDSKNSTNDNWKAKSPFTNEKTPSFHINDNGWYCHSSGQGGGVIELVQRIHGTNCYEAGKWLLEHHCSFLGTQPSLNTRKPLKNHLKESHEVLGTEQETKITRSEKKKEGNKPIRQNLIPLLTQQGTHAEFIRRGISKKTCDYLGCGFLDRLRSGDMNQRIIFQVRGVKQNEGSFDPVVLTHMGRATTDEQAEKDGKWTHYAGFQKTLEIYNIDKLLLDDDAIKQAKDCGHVVLVEGCFDVAKLVEKGETGEKGILNCVATFGAHLNENQIQRLELIAQTLDIDTFLVWYDRGSAGVEGQEKAVDLIQKAGFKALSFDWNQSFPSSNRGMIQIPENIDDPGDFSPEQLCWLRQKNVI